MLSYLKPELDYLGGYNEYVGGNTKWLLLKICVRTYRNDTNQQNSELGEY